MFNFNYTNTFTKVNNTFIIAGRTRQRFDETNAEDK